MRSRTINRARRTVVVMNQDASPGVSAELRFGTLVPAGLETFAWVLIVAGLVVLVAGAWLLDLGLRRWSDDPWPEAGVDRTVTAPETEASREPVGSPR